MKQYEFMKAVESVLRLTAEKQINVQDVRHLPMYEEYRRLKSEGLKVTYIVNYLCMQYEVPEPTIYRVIKRMERKV